MNISEIREPLAIFSAWKIWTSRDTTRKSSFDDMPDWFDVPGVYLLARFTRKSQLAEHPLDRTHLNPRVIYIGQSGRIVHRMEYHEKVRKDYVVKYADKTCKYLYFTIAHPEWHPFSPNNRDIARVRNAWLHYFERRLLWEYGHVHGRLPEFNKY
jgi:hypothetical protein